VDQFTSSSEQIVYACPSMAPLHFHLQRWRSRIQNTKIAFCP